MLRQGICLMCQITRLRLMRVYYSWEEVHFRVGRIPISERTADKLYLAEVMEQVIKFVLALLTSIAFHP